MVFTQKVRNGELGDRKLRYSQSVIKSIKESDAKNRSTYSSHFAVGGYDYGSAGDDGLGVRTDDKKFKMVSDKTSKTISQFRDKASGLIGKKQFS